MNCGITTPSMDKSSSRSLFIPQIPSLTREEGMKTGLKPALVQWKFPLGQAAVPVNTCGQTHSILLARLRKTAKIHI